MNYYIRNEKYEVTIDNTTIVCSKLLNESSIEFLSAYSSDLGIEKHHLNKMSKKTNDFNWSNCTTLRNIYREYPI